MNQERKRDIFVTILGVIGMILLALLIDYIGTKEERDQKKIRMV